MTHHKRELLRMATTSFARWFAHQMPETLTVELAVEEFGKACAAFQKVVGGHFKSCPCETCQILFWYADEENQAAGKPLIEAIAQSLVPFFS